MDGPSTFRAIVSITLACAAGRAAADDDAVNAPPPLSARVELETPRPMVGEPTFVRFVVVNPTRKPLQLEVGGDYRNRLGRPETFEVEVVDENGIRVPQPDAGMSLGGIVTSRPIPAGGTLELELFLPHWATFSVPGTYTMTVRRPSHVSRGREPDLDRKRSTSVLLEATTSFEVVPVDDRAMGRRIEQIAEQMLDPKGRDTERATKLLAAFDDPRIVPHFVKLARQPHQSPRFRACEPLGRFDDDRALDALVDLAKTTWQDVRNGSTTQELATSSAASVRHSAAVALSRSPHPKALERLWMLRDDPSYAVRMTVLHAAAARDSDEARRLVLDMANDPHPDVRREAIRYATR